ncbi:MAG: family 10 glycosylhydrolase, partial [Limisphaerales bacterium]
MSGPSNTGGSSPRWQFDPGHPEVQRHTFNVAMDIISRYDVDGFNFDYIRYPEYGQNGTFQPWGYNPVSVERFNRKYGRTGEPAPDDPQWSQFRRDQVSALVRKIYLSAIAIKPHVKLSADTITWGHNGVTNYQQWLGSAAYSGVLQDWRGWMEEGILDLNIPMNYYRHHNNIEPTNHAKAYTNWANFAMDHAYNRQVAIGPGLYLNSIENGIIQLRHSRSITAAGNSAVGACGYVYHQTNKDGIANSVFYDAVVNPSAYDPIHPPIYSQPATIPAMPWKTAPTRGHLKGFVVGGNATNYLDDATVVITGPISRTLSSDGTGFYGAVDLVPGNYTATASFPDYANVTKNFTVTAGVVTTVDFQLPSAIVTIVDQPTGLTVRQGTNATFSVTATGELPLSYQWLFEGVAITGGTSASLTLNNVQAAHQGNYSVVVSNAFGGQLSSNAFLKVLPPIATTGAEPLWNLAPGSRTYLTTNGTERGLAYNGVTDHLLLVSRAGGAKIYALSPDTGAEVRMLNTDTNIINGGYLDFTLQMVGVADDGAVYACNMVLAPGNGFKIYRWQNEDAATVPTVAFEGNPWPGNSQRWGDTFAVRGSGTNTLLLAGSRSGTNFCVFTTQDGVTFTPTTLSVPSVSGGLGLAFGFGKTFWGKNIPDSLRQVQFDLTAGTATIVRTVSTSDFP